MRRNGDFFEPLAKPKGLLNFGFPVDNMGDDLILAVKVAALSYFFNSSMQLLLTNVLVLQI